VLGIVATQLTTPDTTRSLTVAVNGVDLGGNVLHDSVVIEDQGTAVQGTTSFHVKVAQSSVPALVDQAIVTIEDHLTGDLAFRGLVDSRRPIRLPLENRIEVVASDHTALLDNVIPYELRPAGEGDAARIGYLWGLYGGGFLSGDLTYVQSVNASLPAQQFAGVSLRQALDMIAAQASASAYWRLDTSGRLHYGETETNDAPANVTSDTPGGGEIAPMDLTIDFDSKAYVSAVYIRGKTDAGSGWVRSDAARVAAGGLERTAFLNAADSTTTEMRDAIGAAYLARTGSAISRGTFSVTSEDGDGWRAGQYVTVRSTHLNVASVAYRIARVRQSVLGPRSGRPAALRLYEVEFGAASTPSTGGTGPVVGTGIVGDLLDDGGNLLLGSGTSAATSGLGSALRRFILSGVYNGDFALMPPYPDSTIVQVYNPLPFWTFTQASGTAITAISVADAASGSGRVVRLDMAAGAAGDDSYLEQIIPINASRTQTFYVNPRLTVLTGASTSTAKVYIAAQFLTIDGATTGTAGTYEATTASIGASTLADISATPNDTAPPTDAAYLRVRWGLKRDAAATSATDAVSFTEASLSVGNVRAWIADGTSPGTYAPFRIFQSGGVASLNANYTGASGSAPGINLRGSGTTPVVQLVDSGGNAELLRWGGSSFPASPTTNDTFYRTDLGAEFYYDGTRWLSQTLHTLQLPPSAALPNFAATTAYANRASTPPVVGSDVYLVSHRVGFLILGGGSALSGSHKWVGTVLKNADAGSGDTTITTVNIDSGSSSVYRTVTTSINALLNSGTLHDSIATTWTKTGTPGNLVAYAEMVTYRHVAT